VYGGIGEEIKGYTDADGNMAEDRRAHLDMPS